jgi:hypothetical protein
VQRHVPTSGSVACTLGQPAVSIHDRPTTSRKICARAVGHKRLLQLAAAGCWASAAVGRTVCHSNRSAHDTRKDRRARRVSISCHYLVPCLLQAEASGAQPRGICGRRMALGWLLVAYTWSNYTYDVQLYLENLANTTSHVQLLLYYCLVVHDAKVVNMYHSARQRI